MIIISLKLNFNISLLLFFSVNVTYKGKSSHASAYPWEGLNALDAAVLAYNNVSAFRQQMKPKWKIHGKMNYQ